MGFAGAVLRFFIIFNSIWGKDEPQTLRYAITQNCSMGADVKHYDFLVGSNDDCNCHCGYLDCP